MLLMSNYPSYFCHILFTCAQYFVCHFLEKGGNAMLHDGVSLIPVFVVVVLLDLLFLQLVLLHHKLTGTKQQV